MTPEQKLDLLMVEPTAPNAVVVLTIGYVDSPKTYTYAAIRTAAGQWYLTGEQSPQGYRWRQLIEWLAQKGATVHTIHHAPQHHLEPLL